MPNWLQRGIQGAIQGATGSTNAILYNLQRLKEEEMLKRREKSQAILDSLNQARIGELNKPEPAKLPNLGEIKAQLYRDNPEEYYKTLQREAEATRAPEKPESPKDNYSIKLPSGLTLSGTSIEELKQKAAEAGMGMFDWKNLMNPQPKPDDITPPLRREAGEIAQYPFYMFKENGQKTYLPKEPAEGKMGIDYFANEAYGKRDSILADWTGAQPQPAPNKTGALMPFDLGGMTGGGATQAGDSEIAKAQAKVASGEWSKEKYNAWLSQWIGQ